MHIIFQKGLNAAKKNAGPGFLLQGFALTLVLLYYFHAPTHQFLLKIPAIKERMGIFFPILSTAFFGGLIPFLFMAARKEIPRGHAVSNLLFLLGFWGFNGLNVDFLYKAQAVMFGDHPDVVTVIKKVCFDQFVYNPVWAVPWSVSALYWKNCDFSFQTAKARFSRSMFARDLISVLLATWAVWIPTVAIVYSLPLALQFPLVCIVSCFWSLLLVALNNGEKQ